ncbi:hypothetical protein OPT61_g4229 [Boeremia exigua]|uniref:Uncharacterized protein n=1 Tax=Boeremia exigua TaxID=749465 RepID=A0ACC2IEY7_9PLEO|nr:hypothetical protein OPT61_g4229 [Boeremia exigua]
MKAAVNRFSKLNFKTCKVSYTPTYSNHILNHIATNPSHPLYTSQRRRQQEHEKKGLWWHATNGTDISKSGCVRTWARRRLGQAFAEELKAKGFDEDGKLVNATAMQDRRDVMNVLNLGRSIDLTGSLRMHGLGPLIPAKFATVKEEMRSLVELLIQNSVDTALGFSGEGERSSGLGQRSTHAGAPSQSRKAQGKKPVAAPQTLGALKKKPDSALVQAAKELLRVKPKATPRPPGARNTAERPKKIAVPSAPLRIKPQAAVPKAASRSARLSRGLEEI